MSGQVTTTASGRDLEEWDDHEAVEDVIGEGTGGWYGIGMLWKVCKNDLLVFVRV